MIPTGTTRAIYGCLGPELLPAERAFFRHARPFGFILFTRNIQTATQTRALCAQLREAVGWNAPILIDQEGGRVDRLGALAPHPWRPALDQCETLGAQATRAMWLRARLIAEDLRALGIDVNCTPLGDIARDETHPVLRNRTYGHRVETVIARARANASGTLAGGVLPVLKHIPGHGRGTADSHLDLPRVDTDLTTLEASDFAVFRALADLPLGMSAHVVYGALDSERPGTISPVVQAYVRAEIGFDGLMMTDDLSMQALPGDHAQRARDSLAAGIDLILHCNGEAAQMQAIAAETPAMTPAQIVKATTALALRTPHPIDITAARAEFEAIAGAR